jgi:molybdate transport system substrate-binding protein
MKQTIRGVSSMATRQILADLANKYIGETGQEVDFHSTGGVTAAQRVRDGEPFDVVVLAADALQKLENENHILPGTRIDFTRSAIAMAIRSGAPHPRLNDEQDVTDAILGARAIAYSTGPSGAHFTKLTKMWGVEQNVADRLVNAPPGVPVAALIARGDAEIGFQQLSELLHEPGIEVVGLLPPAIQSLTLFSIGLGARGAHIAASKDFCAYLTSSNAVEAIRRHGMEPA